LEEAVLNKNAAAPELVAAKDNPIWVETLLTNSAANVVPKAAALNGLINICHPYKNPWPIFEFSPL
jgi:hypothetical protein